MATTSTSPEAIADLRSAIDRWGTSAIGIARQASAAAAALVTEIEAAVRARSARKAALEALLRSAKDADRGRLAGQLHAATASLESARSALQDATDAARATQTLQRRINDCGSGRVPEASRALTRKLGALSEYQSSAVRSTSTPTPAATTVADRGYGVQGIVDVPIDQARFDDNPIQDGYYKGGADIADYRWAVETWETVVRPGVLAGKTREDFEQRDTAIGQHTGFRRTAGVFDMFLGNDPIQFSRRADGTLDVSSGRHRVQVAQRLGLTHLPGRLHG